MKRKNNIKMNILATLDNVSVVRVAVSSFVSNLDITVDELMDIKTAVSEAVTNSIEHAYSNEELENRVEFEANIYEENDAIVEVIISDNGCGIDDIELATTPAYTSKPELEHAGMGFTIMETFMDEIVINSSKGAGTVITMKKKIKKNCLARTKIN